MSLFLSEKTFEGNYTKTPLAFRTVFDDAELNKLTLSLDGTSLEQNNPVGPQELKTAAYYQLYSHLGALFTQNMGPGISKDKFFEDGFVALYDLTKSGRGWASQAGRQPVKAGNLKLEIGFTENLTNPLLLFAVSEFHSSFSINKNKGVQFNFVA